MHDYVVSLIRTWVPLLIGAVITWAARNFDIVLDEQTTSTTLIAVTGIVTGLYYAIVRYVETKAPAVGVLLGKAKAPAYSETPAA